jgi:aminoglycoside phosphotransferase (APT) family kinase protein
MALKNQINLRIAKHKLNEWLFKKLPEAQSLVVSDVEIPSSNGLSYETVLFNVAWTENNIDHHAGMVARVCPKGEGLHPSYNLWVEAEVIRKLYHHTSVPLPKILFYEEEADVFGAPFLVMSRVEGRTLSDNPPFTVESWLLKLSAKDRGRLYDNGLVALAEIHMTDWQALSLDMLPKGIESQIKHYEEYYKWSSKEGENNSVITSAFNWIRENRPLENGRLVLNWGDARLGNMIFDDQLNVAAVLDWEMASIDRPELDIAHWLFVMRVHTEGHGVPLPAGFPDKTAVVERYESLTGYKVNDLHFYEVLATLRSAIILRRLARVMVEQGVLPPDSTMGDHNPAIKFLEQMLEIHFSA